jgi:chromatin remodeling complex protein RSC6
MGKSALTSIMYKPSNELSEVLGSSDSLPKTQVIKKVWEYIKANNLQDPKEKRYIMNDSKLKKVFGNEDRTFMMKISGHLSKNLTRE